MQNYFTIKISQNTCFTIIHDNSNLSENELNNLQDFSSPFSPFSISIHCKIFSLSFDQRKGTNFNGKSAWGHYWYNGHVDGHGIYSFSRSVRTDRGSTFSLIPMHSELGWYPWTMVRDGQHGNLSRSFPSPRLPSPFVRLLARSPSLRRGANKIERTHERRSHEACVRACVPRVSVRERVSWAPLVGGWGLRCIGSDGSSIPSFRTSIRGTNHRFLPIIFREIDNYVSFDWRQGFETIVNDLRVVLCNINESSV